MILYFNPGHETAVGNASPYYTAPANVLAMQTELAFLPAWYGTPDDAVLLEKVIDKEFYTFLSENLNFSAKAIPPEELPKYSEMEISLWGVSPQAVHFFAELNRLHSLNLNIPLWHSQYIYLHSRQAARDLLSDLVSNMPQISNALIPLFYSDVDSIGQAVETASCQLLAKAPYSSSGRGLLWLPTDGLTRTERQILRGILKKQGSVAIEQVLDKQTDFAMEFMCDGKGGVEFAGYSLFYTNPKGAYLGNFIGSQEDISGELTQRISLVLLQRVKDIIILHLKEKYASIYKGCIGVDMLIYKEDSEYKLQPCLEINMRYNMGYLAIQLYKNYISPNWRGRFYIDFSSEAGEIYKRHLVLC